MCRFKEIFLSIRSKHRNYKHTCLLICIALFIISGTKFIIGIYQDKHEKELNEVIQATKNKVLLNITENIDYNKDSSDISIVEDTTESQEDITDSQGDTEPVMLAQYVGLWEQNNDMAGWLTIEGTQIDYPVMYTPNEPEYYLHRAFDDSKSSSGCLFIGEKCTPDASHVIIYGHHMKNKTMLGTLNYYADEEYAKEHAIINYDTLYEQKEYEVITAFYSQIYPEDISDVFRYYWYVDLDNEESFKEYMEQVNDIALYDLGTTVEFGDELLTLSTCSYHTNNGRFVVVARRLK